MAERMFRCRHVHASGRPCAARLPFYGRCSLHAEQAGRPVPCGECMGMLAAFPRRDGQALVSR